MLEQLSISRLRVRKDWFVGLNPDPNDHSKPAVSETHKDNIGGKRRWGLKSAGW